VYPEELEDLLNRSPFVMESLVYGEDDPKQGESIAAQVVVDAEAFIELAETRGKEITPELMKSVIGEEIASVNKEVPPYKQIRKFYIRDRGIREDDDAESEAVPCAEEELKRGPRPDIVQWRERGPGAREEFPGPDVCRAGATDSGR